MKNSKKENQRNAGRNIGSKNKLGEDSRESLKDLFKDDFQQLYKVINSIPHGERIIHLKHLFKLLTRKEDIITDELREVAYNSLKPHYQKIGFYFPHLDNNKKVSELRMFLQMLSPSMIEEVLKDMKERQKFKFKK